MGRNTKRILKVASVIFLLTFVVLASVGYLYYRDLKKTFVTEISGKTSSAIGQRIEIGDLSFSPTSGINLYNINIKNPEGFGSGQLLKVKRLCLNMRFRELFKQKFSFSEIAVYSPELTLMRDKSGRLNVSDEMRRFFSKETSIKYEVDRFNIYSGLADFNGDRRYRNEDINLQLRDISSDPSVRTTLGGKTVYGGESTAYISGWAYLKDPAKRLNISASSKNLVFAVSKGFLTGHDIDVDRVNLALKLDVEGDREKGYRFKSEVRTGSRGFAVFKESTGDILLDASALLSMRDGTLKIDHMSLHTGNTGNINSAVVSGEIRNLFGEPFYSADLKINRFDLSVFNFLKGMRARGVVTSDNIHLRGNFRKFPPQISGEVQLRDGAITSRGEDIKKLDASLKCVSNGEAMIKIDATAELSKIYGYSFEKPAHAGILLTVRGSPKSMSVASTINLSPLKMHFRGGKTIYSDRIVFAINGGIRDKIIAGKSSVEMKGITFTGYHTPLLLGTFAFEYRDRFLTVTNLSVEGAHFTTSAERVAFRLPDVEKRVNIEIKGLNASYPAEEAKLKKGELFLRLNRERDSVSGGFSFSFDGLMVGGAHVRSITGSGLFDGKDFSLDIPKADVSGGKVQLTVKGRLKEGPFPASFRIDAENVDIGDLSKAISRISGITYDISGDLKNASFEGILNSADSWQGNAAISADKITLRKREGKRDLVKDAALEGAMEFRGKDVDFQARAGVGRVSASISGTVKNPRLKNRSASIKVKLPGVKVSDIRHSFWEVFPDSLLYVGLEGSLSSDLTTYYDDRDLKINGQIELKGLSLRGENDEYLAGPINGILPVAYSKSGGKEETIEIPSFDRSEFSSLSRYYSQKTPGEGFSRITVGSLRYGFKFLEGIDLLIRQKGSVLDIGHFGGTIFGGRLNGAAVLNLSKGLNYKAGMVLEGLSLTKLCGEIEPIKGYISGKVNGIAVLKGSGIEISQILGKADFWTYSADDEKTKISKEFLSKVGGPSLKAYLGDRRFDKGVMSLYLEKGFVIFKELEISHKNLLGATDLSIKVAPFNNRIAVDHLMWSIIEAAQRAKEK